MTVIIVPIVQTPPHRCPHCDNDLPGWSKPSKDPWWFKSIVFFVVFYVTANIITGLIHMSYNAIDSRPCADILKYPVVYVLPVLPPACLIGKFLVTPAKTN
jgi:hypothetical protein